MQHLHSPSVKRIRRMGRRSAYTGQLPRGCVLCEKGAKLVLLVTGKCSRRCCYCPLSAEKRGKDAFFANEKRVVSTKEVLHEAELMDALGTGVTGGDPLAATDRTVECIRALKNRFGAEHQIHLYTSTTDSSKIARVAKAGLDEIRFHPPLSSWLRLERSPFGNAIRKARAYGLDVGLEIPVVPGRQAELASAIEFADDHELDFVNLNELEFSETNWRSLRSLGLDTKEDDDTSSGVAGSEELALDLLRLDADVPLHYCSSAFKDGIQLKRRITRRARNVRKPHEILTKDGTFVKGVVETSDPAGAARDIASGFDVPMRLLWVDEEKGRLEVAPWVLEEIAPELELPCYIVEEYPTADRLEVERRPLTRR